MQIDIEQLVWALSNTVDLVGVDEIQHSKRVAFMALHCAELLGISDQEVTLLYRTGLLHDCGVSSSIVHKKLVNELEWEKSDKHCGVGAKRLSNFAAFAPLCLPIQYHHTKWERLVDIDISEKDKRSANLIFLLDRIDALVASSPLDNRLATREYVYFKLNELRDSFFLSEFIDLFMETSRSEAFWITMERQHLEKYLLMKREGTTEEVVLDAKALRAISGIFAEVVDAKSSYTAEHSYGVANLSRHLAEQSGLDEETCLQVEIAGLLHDLGKLQIPDLMLEYRGSLDDEALSTMRHHSFITFQILKQITGFEQISHWAADHHEKLNGSGYPFKKTADDLPLPSRIIAVADICQALAQDRPYRKSQSMDNISKLLEKQVNKGLLDQDVVQLVLEDQSLCYNLAKFPSNY